MCLRAGGGGAVKLSLVDIATLDRVDIRQYFLDFVQSIGYIVEDGEPDILIFGDHGRDFLKHSCLKIHFSDENIRPDLNMCNYAIGFDHTIDQRYTRFPLWLMYVYDLNLALNKHLNPDFGRSGFCSFVVSNECLAMRKREDIFRAVSSYKCVDSGGGFLNNIGYRVKDKILFQRQYKFCLCVENSSFSGYTTEKILQGFASGCVPIYYGDKDISNDRFAKYFHPDDRELHGFNRDAFINLHDFESLEAAVDYIERVDQDDALYASYLRAPALSPRYVEFYRRSLEEFLVRAFTCRDTSNFDSQRVIWRQMALLESKMSFLQRVFKFPMYHLCRTINAASLRFINRKLVDNAKVDAYFALRNKKF